MMRSVPEPLARAFAERVTVSGPELCRLLPMDRSTLRGHTRAGRLVPVKLGLGGRSPLRFTLEAVLEFLAERSETPCRSFGIRSRPSTTTSSSDAGGGIEGLLAARLAEKQRQRNAKQ